MKKILFYFLLCVGITLTSCSDDDPKIPFQFIAEDVEGLSGNTLNVLGYEDKTVEIPLGGVSNDVTTNIIYDSENESEDGWLSVTTTNSKESGSKAVLAIKGYDKIKQRKASVSFKSGEETLVLNVIQQGAPVPGQLKFAPEQPDGFKDGSFTLLAVSEATFEIPVIGITEGLSVEVKEENSDWLHAQASEDDSKITVTVEGYRESNDRTGIITIKSGIDELVLQVTQTGVGEKTEMIVVNEGQFTKGTAAISAIKYTGAVEWDVFRSVNNMPLGDVAQSMTYIDGKYFVVLNNSKQIKVIEPETFKLLGTVDYVQAASPRFMVAINDKEAVVSDLNTQLTVINYKDYSVVKHISLSKAETGQSLNQIEKITRVGNKIFCAALGNGAIWVWDVNNISATSFRRIAVRGITKTAKMVTDKNGKLWVMGSYGVYEYPKLFCIDPDTEEIISEFQVPVVSRTSEQYTPGCIVGTIGYNRMDTDRTGNKLYFVLRSLVSKGETSSADVKISTVYSFDVDTQELKPHTQLPGLGMMYGMGISPDGEVYMCDCLDYTAQRGYIRHYKNNALVDSKMVGVYPRMIHFTEYDK
ncbi:MAG: BACON domain-containing carbohydrate-binding protein [Dysgonomonas sp.]|nr:BACON domain-containing carbohydrate-binding protein [Dysgonomonas sp.]